MVLVKQDDNSGRPGVVWRWNVQDKLLHYFLTAVFGDDKLVGQGEWVWLGVDLFVSLSASIIKLI